MKKISINKKYVIWISLVLIIALGIYLRSYHINYPTIGYHNMKEDEFLSFAVNMHDSGDYFRTTWFDCSVSTNDYYGNPYEKCNFNEGETPVSIWSMILFFSIFGWKLWVARLFIILFSIGTIIILYLIVKKLSDKEYLAVLSSLFYAMLPLAVFFGRNIQMDSPSLFLGLCALYFLLLWIDNRKFSTFVWAAAFIILTSFFKITTLVVLAPLIFLLPYKELINKKYWREYIVIAITLILSVSWMVFIAGMLMPYANVSAIGSGKFIGANNWIDLSFSIFSGKYWTDYGLLLKSYASDNYSMVGLWSILLGFCLFLIKYKSKISKFMIGYAIGIIIYIILFAYKWNAHNYYQFPFLGFAAICLANIIFQFGVIIAKVTKIKYLQFVPLLLIILFIAPFTKSTMQQFNTQFYGQDIAGKYINEHTEKGEIFLLERSIQGQVSWEARRFYYSIPDNVSTLEKIEKEKNLRYIVLTNYGISTVQQKGTWNYIQNNYHIAQAGFIQTGQGSQLYHLVLERGGTFNISQLNSKQPNLAETYELSIAKVPYYVIG